MDGPRPNEELSQAPDLLNILEFYDHDRFFVKELSSTSSLVVMRPMNNADGVSLTALSQS
jgi:hypothetical protein